MAERQHELTMIVSVKPGERADLVKYLEETIGYQRQNNANNMLMDVDGLHFMSLFTFSAKDIGGVVTFAPQDIRRLQRDPGLPLPPLPPEPAWLVLEASFDGPAFVF